MAISVKRFKNGGHERHFIGVKARVFPILRIKIGSPPAACVGSVSIFASLLSLSLSLVSRSLARSLCSCRLHFRLPQDHHRALSHCLSLSLSSPSVIPHSGFGSLLAASSYFDSVDLTVRSVLLPRSRRSGVVSRRSLGFLVLRRLRGAARSYRVSTQMPDPGEKVSGSD